MQSCCARPFRCRLGRTGSDEALRDVVQRAEFEGWLSPDLIVSGGGLQGEGAKASSTKLRQALRLGDQLMLRSLLHPDENVADYLFTNREVLYAETCRGCGECFQAPRAKGRFWRPSPDSWSLPMWYCRGCWQNWHERPTLLVGITGSTRSGKSTLADGACRALNEEFAADACGVVRQDDFLSMRPDNMWIRRGDQWLKNWEVPERTDWAGLVRSIEQAAANHNIVLVEGFFLLYDERVRALLDRFVFVAIDEATCRERRGGFPYGWPSNDAYFDECIWPSYRQYEAFLFSDKPQQLGDSAGVLAAVSPDHVLHLQGTESPDILVRTLTDWLRQWLSQ